MPNPPYMQTKCLQHLAINYNRYSRDAKGCMLGFIRTKHHNVPVSKRLYNLRNNFGHVRWKPTATSTN